MKFEISASGLKQLISVVKEFNPEEITITVSSNVELNMFAIRGLDNVQTLEWEADETKPIEKGSVIVSYASFTNLAHMASGKSKQPITFSLNDEKELVVNGAYTQIIKPREKTYEGETPTFVDAYQYRVSCQYGLGFILHSLSKDNSRLEFTGACIQDGKLIATNGHCMSIADFVTSYELNEHGQPVVCENHNIKPIIPGTICRFMNKTMKYDDGEILISKDVKHGKYTEPGMTITFDLVKGLYPDFLKALPSPKTLSQSNSFFIEVNDWRTAIKSLIAGIKKPVVKLETPGTDDRNTLNVIASGKGSVESERKATLQINKSDLKTNFSINIDGYYLLEMLKEQVVSCKIYQLEAMIVVEGAKGKEIIMLIE